MFFQQPQCGCPQHYSGERVSLSWATRCIRFSCAMSGATQMSTGSTECSLAHSRVAM